MKDGVLSLLGALRRRYVIVIYQDISLSEIPCLLYLDLDLDCSS
jgi:hypothetical protein